MVLVANVQNIMNVHFTVKYINVHIVLRGNLYKNFLFAAVKSNLYQSAIFFLKTISATMILNSTMLRYRKL